LSDKLSKYLPDYPSNADVITIEHLLTHTSGIPDFSSQQGFSLMENNDYSPAEFYEVIKGYSTIAEPGEAYNYSNSGYFILGYIIERVSGQTYGEYLENEFFVPLGMEDTYYDFPSLTGTDICSGYSQQSSSKFVVSKKISMSIPFAAGALVSTVEDLSLWYKALKMDKVVNAQSLARAQSPFRLKNGKYTRYGYGWDLGTLGGSKLVAHGGAISGFYSALVYLPTEDVLAVVLTNCNWIDASFFDLATRLAAVAIEVPYFKEENVSKEDLKMYEGVYKSAENQEIAITIEGGSPYLTLDNGRKRLLSPIDRDLFYSEVTFTTVQFNRNRSYHINGLKSTRARDMEFYKSEGDLPKKSIYLAMRPLIEEDVDEAVDYYRNLKLQHSTEFVFGQSEDLNRLGYELLAENRTTDAIKIFLLLVSEFPDESNSYDSLGEAYYINKQFSLSKKNYQKSLDLDPENSNARKMLQKM